MVQNNLFFTFWYIKMDLAKLKQIITENQGKSMMLKKLFITMGLVCSYLSLIIILHRNGIEEMLNIAICSGLLGITLKIWVQNTLYIYCSLGVLALCFFWLQEYVLLEMMLMTSVLGIVLTQLIRSQSLQFRKTQSL